MAKGRSETIATHHRSPILSTDLLDLNQQIFRYNKRKAVR
ncbi:hypothetical protein AM1_3368 [Acaryochloris marina MBIC11017]|uniref:Uncharacterized protein n=1 Tax=Acaryochloris marina (strain MBIC 11017) TaxID=329726 RepID=B0C015_ACAM1|nr:hypothetical protein AM1_3368 [Acaryochloris marina MBIC11017]